MNNKFLLLRTLAAAPTGPSDVRGYYNRLDLLPPALESADPLKKTVLAGGATYVNGSWVKPDKTTLHEFGHYIGGEFVAPSSGEYFDTVNPANGKVIAKVAQGNVADVDAAVKAAEKGLRIWKALSPSARATHIYNLARALQQHGRLFAVAETEDNGKVIRESRDADIPLAIEHFIYHAGLAARAHRLFPGYEAVGVVGQVIPWNFPFLMLAWKVAPALAAGNTVVLKCAETTPMTALLFAQLAHEVGIPAGVINIITGDGRTGAALVAHPDVKKVAFTGSTDVGKRILFATAESRKKVSMELGGKSPNIVMNSADMDGAIEGVIDGIYTNQGQVCCAGSRLLIQEDIYDEFMRRLKIRIDKLVMGNPLDKAVDMGAVNSLEQQTKIAGLVEQGQREGATVWQPKGWVCPAKGFWYPPTVVEAAPSNVLVREEIFGPVVVVQRFRTPQEAMTIANRTSYGLAASIWTQDIEMATQLATQVEAGVVWINCTNRFSANAPFGGIKDSGFGREGGPEGLLEYLTPKKRTQKVDPKHAPKPVEAAPSGFGTGRPRTSQTIKNWVGGKEARPDGGSSLKQILPDGRLLGAVPDSNRKDIRNAVDFARGNVSSWRGSTAHLRTQLLMFLRERIEERQEEYAKKIAEMTARSLESAQEEVEKTLDRLMYWSNWTSGFGGEVLPVNGSINVQTLNEAIGVVAITAPDDFPLLGFVSKIAPALAMGNAVVALPSEKYPLALAPFIEILRASDIPAGALQILFGKHADLVPVLAKHESVRMIDYSGTEAGSFAVRKAASGFSPDKATAGNIKRFAVDYGETSNWFDDEVGEDIEWLRRYTQKKTIWVPFAVGVG